MNDQQSSGVTTPGRPTPEAPAAGSAAESSGLFGAAGSGSDSENSAASTAQDETRHLKDTTTQSATQVAGTAMDQAQQAGFCSMLALRLEQSRGEGRG